MPPQMGSSLDHTAVDRSMPFTHYANVSCGLPGTASYARPDRPISPVGNQVDRCYRLAVKPKQADNPAMKAAADENLAKLITMAKLEDLGDGDLSSSLLEEPTAQGDFRLLGKEPGVFCGVEIAPAVLRAYSSTIEVEWTGAGIDGGRIANPPVVLATIRGPLGVVLSAERVLLNFLQRLSGIATYTRRFVDAVAGTAAVIADTRKTTPGWRALEKYAVRCGGGTNHRQGLYDAVLIKDNHLAGISVEQLGVAVSGMLDKLRGGRRQPTFIEVEADTLTQVKELLNVAGIDLVLLDNFSLDDCRQAVAIRDELGLRGKVALEVSGGVTLDTVRAVADTGVDRISVGAITHSAPALDLSLERV